MRALCFILLAALVSSLPASCSPSAAHSAAVSAEVAAYGAALNDCRVRAKQAGGDGGLAWYELCAQDVDKQYGRKAAK